MELVNRTPTHQRSQDVEQLLARLEEVLAPIEKQLSNNNLNLQKPIFLIVGCARSGTTLISQFLAQTTYFAYPSNLMSRFYYATHLGSILHKLLIDYDFKHEIFNPLTSSDQFQSQLGKTTGANAPHEFWYFWRRFFKFDEIQVLSESALQNVDERGFISELAAMEEVFDKPLMMKAMIMNWHISYLHKILNKAHFIYVRRDIASNAQSLLEARKAFYNDANKWYSFKPPEYNTLQSQPIVSQVAGQVYYTNKAIEKQLALLPDSSYTIVDYEDFCANPIGLIIDLNKIEDVHIPQLPDYHVKTPKSAEPDFEHQVNSFLSTL